jgi:hypothetical protein
MAGMAMTSLSEEETTFLSSLPRGGRGGERESEREIERERERERKRDRERERERERDGCGEKRIWQAREQACKPATSISCSV